MDSHLGNSGIALPQLEQFTEDEITEHYTSPECIPVVPCDPRFLLRSLPPYFVESVGMASYDSATPSLRAPKYRLRY